MIDRLFNLVDRLGMLGGADEFKKKYDSPLYLSGLKGSRYSNGNLTVYQPKGMVPMPKKTNDDAVKANVIEARARQAGQTIGDQLTEFVESTSATIDSHVRLLGAMNKDVLAAVAQCNKQSKDMAKLAVKFETLASVTSVMLGEMSGVEPPSDDVDPMPPAGDDILIIGKSDLPRDSAG